MSSWGGSWGISWGVSWGAVGAGSSAPPFVPYAAFITTIKDPNVFFNTDIVDHVGGHTTIKDYLAASVTLR